MGQKEKARAIVDERYGVELETALSTDGWIQAARRAAEASKHRLKGKVVEGQVTTNGERQTLATYKVVGPGGVVTVMVFVLSGVTTDRGTTRVSLRVGDFLFQSGSLGMKPTINAGKVMDTFVDVLRTELTAG